MYDAKRTAFEELMAAALEGTATEAERAAFAQALESDPGLVVVYARQARVHVMLEACAAVREGALETCGRKLETGGQRRTAIHGMDCLKAASRVTAKRWRLAAAAAAVKALSPSSRLVLYK